MKENFPSLLDLSMTSQQHHTVAGQNLLLVPSS
ncbi:hypothetical protein Hamer_G007605 [Homarus americanus]|uniref:Uncharacterized protein n=1 Tax=Homarus americanus TaxID=6706 RepID=A0A8J5JN95_HOMAM|nr:hypothetical protein Hamer_G007605 [Homarus americanus]